jgi:cellulose synthase/poly-beta-1,6-N-acetylglucosamine synthase-like glycosyltransferase
MSEDLDIGVRAYLQAGAWPDYLPVPATEQTPPTLLAYFRQRLRWGCGWLQVYQRLLELRPADRHQELGRRRLLRELFLKGHVQWSLYQLGTLLLPVSWWLAGRDGFAFEPVSPWLAFLLRWSMVGYLAFTWWCLLRYRRYMDAAPYPGAVPMAALEILLLPLAAFWFPTPFSTALALYVLGIHTGGWVKTPRTAEDR